MSIPVFKSSNFKFSNNEFSIRAFNLQYAKYQSVQKSGYISNNCSGFDPYSHKNLIIESDATKVKVEFEYHQHICNLDNELIVIIYRPTQEAIKNNHNLSKLLLNIFNT